MKVPRGSSSRSLPFGHPRVAETNAPEPAELAGDDTIELGFNAAIGDALGASLERASKAARLEAEEVRCRPQRDPRRLRLPSARHTPPSRR